MRQAAENHVRDCETPRPQGVDEVLAIGDRRRVGLAARRDLVNDSGAIGAEQRDEAGIELPILGDEPLALVRVELRAAQRRAERLHGLGVRRDVLVDVLPERGHRLVQAGGAVGLLPRRNRLAVDRGEQQHRQHRDEHERVERVVAQVQVFGAPPRRDVDPRRDQNGDELGDDDRDERVQDHLQRDRPDGLAQVSDAVEVRRADHRDRHDRPDDAACEQRRFAAARERARQQSFGGQDDDRRRECRSSCEPQRADERGDAAVERSKEDCDRQRNDPAEQQRRSCAERQRVDGESDAAAHRCADEPPQGHLIHRPESHIVYSPSTHAGADRGRRSRHRRNSRAHASAMELRDGRRGQRDARLRRQSLTVPFRLSRRC